MPANHHITQQTVDTDLKIGAMLLVAAVLLLTLLAHIETASSMVAIWYQSDTFAHGFFIAPISMYLIWQKRDELSQQQIKQNYWILLPLIVTGVIWLMADTVDVAIAKQFALVAMLVQTVWLILGANILRTILFPLLFLFLAVPAGDIITPQLMAFTAEFTVWAIQMTGIPIYREGMYFSIPSGNFEVAKACSGIRYLMASVTVGALYAYMNFHSYPRRIAFIAIAIIFPIFANGIRAYLIVMIAHLSDLKHAVGADHLVYGWVFFGFVVFVLLFIGARMAENVEPSNEEEKDVATIQSVHWKQVGIALFLAAISVAIFPSLSHRINHSSGAHVETEFALPDAVSEWRTVSSQGFDWTPYYANASNELQEVYVREGEFVGVHIALYSHQEQGAELINERNTLVRERDPRWRIVDQEEHQPTGVAGLNRLRSAKLRSSGQEVLVWHWYLVNGVHTNNPYIGKLQEFFSKLAEKPVSMGITLYTDSDHQLNDSSRLLNEFAKEFIPEIDKSFDAINNGTQQ